jgi:uncharacterized membrane protein (Fun14 family)
MNVIKRFLGIVFVLAVIAGCKKDTFSDTSFINGISTPAKLSVMFDITQDNSGLVTIYPNGEGISSYDVYYGDGVTTPATVAAGKNIQHTYAEGVYTVKVVAHNVSGKTAETTQALTVSFRAPENVKATITTNGLAVTVSASASYETLFKVYYGDSLTVVPLHFQSVLEGKSLTHTYPAAGTYTIRVVALSGGAATTEITQTVKVGKQIDLPVTFDDINTDYTVSDFGNNTSSIVADPTNAANKVMKTIKPANAEVWSGTTIGTATGFATKIPVTVASSKMSIRVYSPAAGLDIKLKIEDHNDGTHSVETDVLTTLANQWETLTFDFNANATGTPAFNAAYTYDKASVFFDYGKTGTARTFYADDLKMVAVSLPMTLPVTFDATNVNYSVVDFGNNSTIDGVDPTNAANKIKITTKPNGAEVWAGTTIGPATGFPTKIPFTATATKMSIRVYSPAVGIHMRLKVEDHNDGSKSVETEALSTVANAWETLTFDFSAPASGTPAMNLAYNYDKASIFFDFNVAGSGKKFYWDDVTFVAPPAAVLGFPMDFESTGLNYSITDFNGGGLTVISNPKSSGINTSTRVAQMIKSNGEVYGGSFIALPAPIDFSTKKIFKVKVYSPRVGAKLLLKVENLTDGNTFYQAEVASTVANAWETLTFDYSAVPTNKSFQKLVFIFDNGTKGDGTANYTFLMDDITLN